MTNSFDFFNYNFSALISIFAAMVGMAYPLILQTIQRVDEMYQSTYLAKYARDQKQFKVFNYLLLCSIVVSFLAPYYETVCYHNIEGAIIIEVVHTIVIFSLVISAIFLFQFMLVTTDPNEFFQHVRSHHTDRHPLLLEAFQFAKYGSKNESALLFFEAMNFIADRYRESIMSEKPNSDIEESFNAVASELRNILSKDEDSYFKTYEQLVAIYFDERTPRRIKEGAFMQTWFILDTIIYKHEDAYCLNYWDRATTYYDSMESSTDALDLEVLKKFREQHYMILSSFYFRDNLGVITQLMNPHTDVTLHTPLVPSSLREICEVLIGLLNKHELKHYQVSFEYPLREIQDYVNRDVILLDNAMLLATVLIVRLSYVLYCNHYWEKVYSTEFLDGKDRNYLDKILFICNELSEKIEVLYRDDQISKLRQLVPLTDTKATHIGLIDSLRGAAIKRLKDDASRNGTSQAKKDRIISTLKAYLKSFSLLPLNTDLKTISDNEKAEGTTTVTCNQPLEEKMLQDGTPNELSTIVVRNLAYKLCHQLINHYGIIFRNQTPLKIYYIFENETISALTRLGVCAKHCIFMVNVTPNQTTLLLKSSPLFQSVNDKYSFNGARIYFLTGNRNGIIISEGRRTPYYGVVASANIDNFSLVDSETLLYSNIDILDCANIQNVPLKVMRTYRITQSKDLINYHKIEFINTPNATSQIATIQQL